MIRLGGPIFIDTARAAGAGESHGADATDPQLLVRKHQEKGFRAAYAPQVRLKERERVRDIRAAFEAADITIAEVGYWENLLHADSAQAKVHRERMIEALALAEELGACCAINSLGSCVAGAVKMHDGRNFTGDMFDAAVENARYFIDTVKPKNTYFTYELFPFNVNDSPEGILALADAIDRERFGIHMDLVNLVNGPRNYYTSGAIIKRCVALFGDRIVSAHAKDIAMEMPSVSVILREVRPGLGNLDYAAYLQTLNKLRQTVPLMMEHLPTEAEYDLAAKYIREMADREGITV